MSSAVIYCRVSSEEQANEGASLDAQQSISSDYATKQGWKIAGVFVERGVTGSTSDRPELQNLLQFVKENKGQVQFCLVHKVDRLARDIYVHSFIRNELMKYGVKLHSVTENIDETPVGRCMEGMLAVFAEYYRNNLKLEIKKGIDQRIIQGYYPYHPPVGYRIGPRDEHGAPTRVPDEQGSQYVKQTLTDFAYGKLPTLKDARDFLNHTIKIYGWRKTYITGSDTIRTILLNPFYAGFTYNRKSDLLIKGNHVPLISSHIYNRIKNKLENSNQRGISHRKIHPDFPLRINLHCAVCGSSITSSFSTGKLGGKYGYYFCSKSRSHVSIPSVKIEQEFVAYLKTITPHPKTFDLFTKVLKFYYKRKQEEDEKAWKSAQKQITDLNKRKEGVLDLIEEAHLSGDITQKRAFHKRIIDIDAQIQDLEKSIPDRTEQKKSLESLIESSRLVLKNTVLLWTHGGMETKELLHNLLFPEGLFYSPKKGFTTTKLSPVFKTIQLLEKKQHKEEDLLIRTHDMSPNDGISDTFEQPISSLVEWGGLLWNPVIVELNQWDKAFRDNLSLFTREDSKAREQLNQPVSIQVQDVSKTHRKQRVLQLQG